jgi:hypothetical protein
MTLFRDTATEHMDRGGKTEKQTNTYRTLSHSTISSARNEPVRSYTITLEQYGIASMGLNQNQKGNVPNHLEDMLPREM